MCASPRTSSHRDTKNPTHIQKIIWPGLIQPIRFDKNNETITQLENQSNRSPKFWRKNIWSRIQLTMAPHRPLFSEEKTNFTILKIALTYQQKIGGKTSSFWGLIPASSAISSLTDQREPPWFDHLISDYQKLTNFDMDLIQNSNSHLFHYTVILHMITCQIYLLLMTVKTSLQYIGKL